MNWNLGSPSHQLYINKVFWTIVSTRLPTYHKTTKWWEIVLMNVVQRLDGSKHWSRYGGLWCPNTFIVLMTFSHLPSLCSWEAVCSQQLTRKRKCCSEDINQGKLYIRKQLSKGKSTLNHLLQHSWWANPPRARMDSHAENSTLLQESGQLNVSLIQNATETTNQSIDSDSHDWTLTCEFLLLMNSKPQKE